MSEIVCRPPAAADWEPWSRLFQGYMAFYKTDPNAEVTARVWDWLLDPANAVEGLVAERDGRVVGLAHFHAMPRTLGGQEIGYLSDLFTDPDCRGQGIGRALIDACLAIGRDRGWPALRWFTQEFNYPGRQLYDRYAPRSDFIVYMVKTGA